MQTETLILLTLIVGFELFFWRKRRSQIRKLSAICTEKNYELMNWMLFQEKWDGNLNNILYAWRCVLLDLKQTFAPEMQIKMLEKKLREEQDRLTKDRMMFTSSGKIRTYKMIGGNA